MTDQQILDTARDVGWNVEHRASCDYLIRFAKEVIRRTETEWFAPLPDVQIDDLTRKQFGPLAASDMQRQFARRVERAHGIGGKE